MRVKWLGVILGFFGMACHSQPAMERASNNKTLLWEISGKDLKKPSYFFGTMHILCPEDAKLSGSVQKLLTQVKQLYFEVDIDDMAEMFGAMKSMNMKDMRLEDLLSPEDYGKVKTYFEEKSPLPFSMIGNYKPMLLSSMLQEQMMPCKSTNGMELIILNESTKLKLDAKGLETMAFQAGLFDSIPYKDQADELLQAIDSIDTQKGQIDSLLQTYREQDIDAIEKLTLATEGAEGKYMDLLLYNRNRNWVAQFDTIASKGSTLFAVGAGHLPGANGVLELLRKKGYTVTPIKNK